MQSAQATKSIRKPTNLSLDSALLKEVKLHKQQKWLKENARALASSNAYVEANGLPLARHRQF